jgi:diguanylate cyclase (GGDEF)-like protein
VIGGVLRRAAMDYDGNLHVFGEMVALLCGDEHCLLRADGRFASAIDVEKYFNILLHDHAFKLLCGYPMSAFPREGDADAFRDICTLHTSVIPTENYRPSADVDRLERTIATLQQKAFSLSFEVRERMLVEQALKDVNFDRLTGLPNRSVFLDRLGTEIKKANRTSLPLALIFLDLDHFKEINDTLGHALGDMLLEQVGQRISAHVRDSDTVARLGGDEFTVILSQLHDPDAVTEVTQKILQSLEKPFHLNAQIAYITASIGITLYPNDADSVGELLRNGDQAMYVSKESGRNRFTYFTRSMQDAAQNRMSLSNELRGALAGNQLRIAYQPIVDLVSGAVRKAEALLRWQHPVRGLVSPADFIPIAEHTGMIDGIGSWVFREAALRARQWRAVEADFQLSVNVSPAQFYKSVRSDPGWLGHWDKFVPLGEDAPAGMVVEITEGLLLDASSAVIAQLLAFRDAGIQVSLDDFGTGYSSLSYLRKFDIDYLKIDQSFVVNLASNSDDRALCEAIIVMAHKLGLKVIAEGVETQRQADFLRDAGCDYGQGFLYSPALPPDEFEAMLRRCHQA